MFQLILTRSHFTLQKLQKMSDFDFGDDFNFDFDDKPADKKDGP
mgnify:CR=1 FL=1